MEIHTWHQTKNPDWWLKKISQCDWTAGQYLYRLLSENRFRKTFGENAEVLLLTDGTNLAAFCTYAAKDDIPDTDRTPWIGFVYTYPAYRGRRLMGKLIGKAREMAREDGYDTIWIATREEGLYEKYGAEKVDVMKDLSGEDSDIFCLHTYGLQRAVACLVRGDLRTADAGRLERREPDPRPVFHYRFPGSGYLRREGVRHSPGGGRIPLLQRGGGSDV